MKYKSLHCLNKLRTKDKFSCNAFIMNNKVGLLLFFVFIMNNKVGFFGVFFYLSKKKKKKGGSV